MRKFSILSTLVATLLFSIGCNDPKAEKVLQTRETRMQQLFSQFNAREAQNPENLDRMTRLIYEDWEKHQAFLEADGKSLRKRAETELERWRNNQDDYDAAIRKQLKGNLDSAGEVPARIIY